MLQVKTPDEVFDIIETYFAAKKENTELEIRGRHDPCIAQRAVPVVEAVAAIVLLDMLLEEQNGY